MILFVGTHDGVWIIKPLLPEPYSISLKRRMPRTITIDVLPSSRVCVAQLIWSDSDNLAIAVMKGLHLPVKVATMQGHYIRETKRGPERGTREST